MESKKLFDLLKEVGQEHILEFWDELDQRRRQALHGQVMSIDFKLLNTLYRQALNRDSSQQDVSLEPASVITLEQRKDRDHAMIMKGEQLLRRGKIAIFLVAGGQGSRLGFDGPKGVYPISPVKKKSLFQLHAEKIQAINNRYQTILPWYIMTSKTNHEATIAFFNENEFFGLDKKDVMFFQQELMPAVDRNGKLLLQEKDRIFMSPNGHGGSIKAIWDSGAYNDMISRGIESIFYFQVDNVLINIADPAFIGYHKSENSQMSSKVIRKAYPEEKLGVICKINGGIGVIEYSDLSKEDTYAKTADGDLKFWAGSIAIHMVETSFIEKLNNHGFRLPWHIAEKSIPYIDRTGKRVNPDDKNGFKFETFVFDALNYLDRTTTIEVSRQDEFSALKNKTGVDSEESSVKDVCAMYLRWLKRAGLNVPDDVDTIEISALFARTEQELLEKKDRLPHIKNNMYIE